MRQFSGQTDEYSLTKKNETVSHTNEPSFQTWQWWIKNLLPILWDESGAQISAKTKQTQWRTYGKISDQNTPGVRRRKSQTESEQNWFSENKTSWLFFPVSSFFICLWTCFLTWVQTTYESTCVNFFSAIRTWNKIAESREKFYKFW